MFVILVIVFYLFFKSKYIKNGVHCDDNIHLVYLFHYYFIYFLNNRLKKDHQNKFLKNCIKNFEIELIL